MRPHSLAWGLVFASALAVPAHADGLSLTANFDDGKRIASCSDIDIRFWKDKLGADDIVTSRRDQTVALRADSLTPLKVKASDRGGIRVQPSSDGSLSATVCMAAGARSDDAARAILDKLSVESDRGELRVSGPDAEEWAAYIILNVPSDVALELSAVNGCLSLLDVSGHFNLRTTNGPISLVGVGGEVDAEAVNGPVHFKGHSGDIRLVTQNGPVGVSLDQPTWTGKGLEASAQNGPVKVVVPTGVRSGVQVEGSAHSPVRWNGSAEPGLTEDGGSRSFRFGEGPILVHVSTVNGPIEIKAPRRSSLGKTI